MVDAIAVLTMLTVSLGFLFVSLAFGSAISKINGLAYSGVALLAGSLIWLGSILFSYLLTSIPFFIAYVTLFQQLAPSGFLILGNAALTAVFSLIVIIEIGMLGGYGIGKRFRNHPVNLEREKVTQRPKLIGSVREQESHVEKSSQAILVSNDERFLNSPLTSDERTISQLLLFGGVQEIVPKLDDKRIEGYFFEELQSLDWDTKRQTLALNSLARRGFLNAFPKEKILHCHSCGATGLEFRGSCPECSSLSLSRHKVVEHFPCGMIERESAFRTSSGDLVCPKCNKKLELIGNDYRSLGQMYVCQSCGALSKDLSPNLKCRNCGSVAMPEEETEQYLFAYSLNTSMLQKLRQHVKPTETVVNYYKARGYGAYSPAFVRGRSGTEHTFDLMIVEQDQKAGQQITGRSQNTEKTKTFAEILVSDKPIELEEVTRVYGKISDISYPTLIFAVPSLSARAESYALAYKLHVFEGRTMEEALSQTGRVLPKLGVKSLEDSGAQSIRGVE
ncbi:MAG: TackOD1 domain-containing metal-binding protein [Nitrososphaerales archaeon]